jgi:OmpA-OmpF porin, OOP family
VKKITLLALALILPIATSILHAQDADAPVDADGCKDSAFVTRMPGSTIHSCENKEYEQADLVIGKNDNGEQTKHIEGEYHYWDYGTRDGVSEIQVFRNLETALRNGGFHIVYEDPTAKITANKGKTWVAFENSGSYYYQTIITEQEMKQEMTADASSLQDQLEKSGHVAVYGILFDTGKATLQDGSTVTLTQILTLLQQNTDLKLRIEGHTDNVGSSASNKALSQKRADTVRTWLIAKGIAADRLTAQGFGDTKPVADNSTEDGRAKNRRVELAKQ